MEKKYHCKKHPKNLNFVDRKFILPRIEKLAEN
jgi:hypothetical protein